MSDKTEEQPAEDNAGELRGTLIKRLAVAGGLVAVLLGVLAFFDYLASPPEEPEAPVFTQAVPVAPRKEVSQPVTPAENLPEPPVTPVAEPVTEAPPVAGAEPQVPAVVEVKPDAPEKRPAVPSLVGPAKMPAPIPKVPPTATLPPVPEASSAPSVVVVEPAQAVAKPSARLLEARPAPVVVPPAAPRLFSGFLLQAGVFSSAQRAEELHAKLTLSGVPSTLETRVQVGPFRTRQEAEAAQAKLRELGVQTILVPPKSGKPQ